MSLYNSETVDESAAEFSQLPPGTYVFQVRDVKLGETKAKQDHRATKGTVITVKAVTLDHNHPNATVYHRFNIENDSEKAQNIGRAQFKKFHRACGFQTLQLNSDQDLLVLQNRTFRATTEMSDYNGKTYPTFKGDSFEPASQPTTGQYRPQSQMGAGSHGQPQANPGQPVGQNAGSPSLDNIPF